MIDRLPSFALRPEQEALLSTCVQLARTELGPIAAQGTPGRVNRPLVKAVGARGLIERALRRGTPESGPSLSVFDLCLIREGLARASPEAETAFALQGLGGYPILRFGAPEVVDRFIPGVIAGDVVAAFALTEPDAGSDLGSLSLEAKRDGNGFRLTGTKRFISNAPDADVYSLFARTSDAGARGLTAFAIPGDSPGVSGAPLRLIAPHAIGELRLDDVYVSDAHVLGETDRGFSVAMETLNRFRPSVGAFAVGMAQAALDAATEYVKTRTIAGRPLAEKQAVAHRLADLATQLEAARLLVYRAASLADASDSPPREAAAMAKLYGTETAQVVIDGALQLHGAVGLEEGHLLAHLYQEVRSTRIYEGASEVQRDVVARAILSRKPIPADYEPMPAGAVS